MLQERPFQGFPRQAGARSGLQPLMKANIGGSDMRARGLEQAEDFGMRVIEVVARRFPLRGRRLITDNDQRKAQRFKTRQSAGHQRR